MILGISTMIAIMIDPQSCPRVWDDIDSLQRTISSLIGLY